MLKNSDCFIYGDFIFVVCSIWCKTLFIVVVVVYKFVALKVVRLLSSKPVTNSLLLLKYGLFFFKT